MQLGEHRRDAAIEDLRSRRLRDARNGRVGAHPAGVRAGVALPDPLVVLRDVEGQQAPLPSVSANTQTSRPSSNSSTRIVDPASPRLAQEAPPRRRLGRLAIAGHRHALAGGKAVGLHDVRSAELVEERDGLLDIVEDPGAGGRDAATGQTSFAHDLEPSILAAAADGPKTA